MSIVRLYAIRHGQTQYNLERRIQGDAEGIGLNETGKEEALATGKNLRSLNIHFDRLICSPLQRARETLDIIQRELQANYFDLLKFDPRIRERSFGELHHKTHEYLDMQVKSWSGLEHDYRPPKGESRRDLLQRAIAWIEEQQLIARSLEKNENWLVVTHGGILSCLSVYINRECLSQATSGMFFKNGGINVIELGGDVIKLLSVTQAESPTTHQ